MMIQHAGYNFIWAFLISLTVFAGSGQFLLVSLLSGGASLPMTAAMTLLINSRHMFYGLSFLDRFKKTGRKYIYMIFSLTDETYSVLCSVKPEKDVEEGKAMFLIALFNHIYWILGSVLGALLGQFLPLNLICLQSPDYASRRSFFWYWVRTTSSCHRSLSPLPY